MQPKGLDESNSADTSTNWIGSNPTLSNQHSVWAGGPSSPYSLCLILVSFKPRCTVFRLKSTMRVEILSNSGSESSLAPAELRCGATAKKLMDTNLQETLFSDEAPLFWCALT